MTFKNPDGTITDLKRWHLMTMLIVLLVGVGINIGMNMERNNEQDSKIARTEKILDSKASYQQIQSLIDNINDLRYDIRDLRKEISNRK